MPKLSLGERELDVMDVLWRAPRTVAEVRERLPVPLAYTTVLTILRNLEAKQFVGHTREGRAYRYHPLIAEQAVRAAGLSWLVKQLFRGSGFSAVLQLLEGELLPPDERRVLRQIVVRRP